MSENALTEDVSWFVRKFVQLVLHGDADHRQWLSEAAEAFIKGTPLPPPNGLGRAESAERELDALRKELEAVVKLVCDFHGGLPDDDVEEGTRRIIEQLTASQKELDEANEFNDSDLPLSEVMKEIHDLVFDFKPDMDSDSAGIITDRVAAAVYCGRQAGIAESKLAAAQKEIESLKARITNENM